MLEISGLRYAWPDGAEFLFDLRVETGRILILQGPSGIGKSTLLSLIAGLLTPESGSIRWGGDDIAGLPPAERPLSILFQQHNLFDHLDCRSNIALGINPALKLEDSEWTAVEEAMRTLGIGEMGRRLPETLSGGQQQRVALARALLRSRLQQRSLLLLDEPFSALDPEIRIECSRIVRQLVEKEGLTALVVSHDPLDVERLRATALSL